ncbi:HD family phosphohydrolase [Neobacillus sp. PS3-40]|uniref:HD family phosphohydrolase n=1 Tax=Neobacillus sp. PS3-40 TaxID=3070679 RepID=UPI0027E07DD4|nr:HD family phosphohydrolase [Neobacillus sp. PS3-40]WML45347.1 HD family phosphohydrolase [Neobacillus sp. PS3-40]
MEKLQERFVRVRKLLDITFFRVLFFLALGIILFLAMFNSVKPEKLDLSLFTVADMTIRSPGTVEDNQSTEKKRKEALDQVQDVYILKKEYTQNRVDLITSIFDSALEANAEMKEELKKEQLLNVDKLPSKTFEQDISNKITRLKAKLTDSVTKDLSDQVFSSLIQAKDDELSIAKDLTVTSINNVMTKRISAENVENAKKKVEEELKYTTLNKGLKSAAIELGRYAVIQNEFYDSSATEELRQQASKSVEPVKILQGQIIVEEGELINREIFRQLKLVGLLDNGNAFKPFLGLAFFIIIFLSSIYYYFYQMKTNVEKRQTYLLMFGIVFAVSILLIKIISMLQIVNFAGIGYLFPAAMGGMLIKILIDEKLAILFSIVMSVCGSILFNEGITGTLNYSEGIYILFSALAGILFLSSQNHRSKILQAGMFAASVNLVTILALLFLSNGHYSGLDYGYYLLSALVSGISSAVLTIGFLPFLESSFGILSSLRLIELSNPNHPLLRKILTEAPGTYHHSVMVANLAESACEAIGANGLLARVGCYYHDVGKTRRPNFFIENQLNQNNPHDRLLPEKSANIIIAHVADGVNILKKYHMPKEIIEIAEQHHGTTLLKYFFHKAQQRGADFKEEEFRYPGPKAQTKENAVVGIADSVEAAVRSLTQPTPDLIESLVKNIIEDRLEDGQLNECDLTLKELEIVSQTLCDTLKGIFHSRIEYPEIIKQKVGHA